MAIIRQTKKCRGPWCAISYMNDGEGRLAVLYHTIGLESVHAAVALAATRNNNNNPYNGFYCLPRELPFSDQPLRILWSSEDTK